MREVSDLARATGDDAIEKHLDKAGAMAYRMLLVFHAVDLPPGFDIYNQTRAVHLNPMAFMME